MTEHIVSLKLDVPRTFEESLEVQGFGEAVVIAMSAMARLDEILTIEEYEALIYAVDYLAEISEHPLLFRVLALNSLFSSIPFKEALQQVSKHSKNQNEDVRNAIMTGVVSLLYCQGIEAKKFAILWAKALYIKEDVLKSVLKNLPNEDETDFTRRIKSIWKSKKASLQIAKDFASTFKDQELFDYALQNENISVDKINAQKFNRELELSTERILKKLKTRLPTIKELEPQERAAKKFYEITKILIDQIEQRLKFISKRMDLQKKIFKDDLLIFIESTTDLIEVGMRDMMHGRDYKWADKGLWEKFANTDVAQKVLLRYKPLEGRYDNIFNLWNAELEEFSKELQKMVKAVFENVDPEAFSKLVKTNHQSVEITNRLDYTADMTLGGSIVAVVGSVALIAMGVIPATAIAGAAAFMVSNPLGWVIGGVLGISMLWKLISNPTDRQMKFIKDKREQIKYGLIKLLEDPEKNHHKICGDIEKEFYQVASKYYAPLARDAYLSIMQPQLEARAIRKVREDTEKACEKLLLLRISE